MLNLNWNGDILVNGEKVNKDFDLSTVSGQIVITLIPKGHESVKIQPRQAIKDTDGHILYKITVKSYMTQNASPEFDFMAKWNNDNPMPLRTMVGWIEKETKGMAYMHLKGMAEPTITCMRCGRELTNPVSRAYGIGPECLCKIGFAGIPIDAVDTIRNKLVEVEWTGWVIKSAIVEQEEMTND